MSLSDIYRAIPTYCRGANRMTLDDIDPAIREFLFAREAMRRLGFAAEDLYFVASTQGNVQDRASGHVTSYGKPIIGLQLKSQHLEWQWAVGLCELAPAEIPAAYEQAATIWNQPGDDDARHALWQQSLAYRRRTQLVAALLSYGFNLNLVDLDN